MSSSTDTENYYYGLGRRKEAIVSARVYKGEGEVTVGDQRMAEYFNTHALEIAVMQPVVMAGQEGKVRISLKASGGGNRGQAEAARLDIARALQEKSPGLRPTLKKAGLLPRDHREKERKKP